MNAQRLLNVANVLEHVPDKSFSLIAWEAEFDCGTVCCAVGWYCKSNVSDGLKLDPNHSFPTTNDEDGRVLRDWEAVDFHFGIEPEDGSHLFLMSSYPKATREAVITRIREFVASRS